MTPRRPSSLLVAEGIALDQLTGRLTVFNVIDAVPVPAAPCTLTRAVIVAVYPLDQTKADFRERVRVVSPTGKEVARSETMVALNPIGSGPIASRSIHLLWAIPLAETGAYLCRLEQEFDGAWTEAATISFAVTVGAHPILNHHLGRG